MTELRERKQPSQITEQGRWGTTYKAGASSNYCISGQTQSKRSPLTTKQGPILKLTNKQPPSPPPPSAELLFGCMQQCIGRGQKYKKITSSGVSHGLEGHDTGVLRDDRPIEVAEAVHVLGSVLEVPVREGGGGYIGTAAPQGARGGEVQ